MASSSDESEENDALWADCGISGNSSDEDEDDDAESSVGGAGVDSSNAGHVSSAQLPAHMPPQPCSPTPGQKRPMPSSLPPQLPEGARPLVRVSCQQLGKVLERTRERLDEREKEVKASTRKSQTYIKELGALLGAARAAPHSDPHVRRLLAGDTAAAANVSSLRPAVDFFFGRRPPMDGRGRALQAQVIDHRAASFHQRARNLLRQEVIDSVSKALWVHIWKHKFPNDPQVAKREVERTKGLSHAELLDEAERANICLTQPHCKVWEEVGHVMWKTNKKCAAECRIQFLNNDDPRIASPANAPSGQPGQVTAGVVKKRPSACTACAARKIRCKHIEGRQSAPERADAWSKQQAQRMVHLVAAKASWQAIAATLKQEFGQHRTPIDVMEYYQRSYNTSLQATGKWNEEEDAVLREVRVVRRVRRGECRVFSAEHGCDEHVDVCVAIFLWHLRAEEQCTLTY